MPAASACSTASSAWRDGREFSIFVGMEGAFTLIAPSLYNHAPGLVWALLHLLPGYHLQNLES